MVLYTLTGSMISVHQFLSRVLCTSLYHPQQPHTGNTSVDRSVTTIRRTMTEVRGGEWWLVTAMGVGDCGGWSL